MMRTKNIFKALALAMMMPAMLLTTACSNQDDVVNTSNITSKGYALPVTVSATRQGDGTRATYNESTKILSFSTGDKLFVYGSATAAGSFAGELDYVPATGKFSGTIYTQKEWTGAADALFTAANEVTATLLPNGYDANSFLSIDNKNTTDIAYDDRLTVSGSNAFVASETAKATGVEQLSLERASTYSSGFALAPGNAILNFTITGLEAGAKDVLLHIHHGFDYDVTGSVTPNASGVATFAVGVPVGANIKDMDNNLTVGSSNFTLPSSTTFTVGKIYNITRSAAPAGPPTGAINGQFSVSSTKKVYFSKGNLQATYNGTDWTWAFAANQWDYIGNAEGNTKVTNTTPFVSGYSGTSTTVDLFGWVGASSGFTGAAQYGITSSDTDEDYGNVYGEALISDWGNTMGSGWRTLSSAEWTYLFVTRTNAASKFGYATVAGKVGIIIVPDDFTDPMKNNSSGAFVGSTTTVGWTANVYSAVNWSAMETAGCVFLPAAGNRYENEVSAEGSLGFYWSSSSLTSDVNVDNIKYAHPVQIMSSFVDPGWGSARRPTGCSVRLVRDVE